MIWAIEKLDEKVAIFRFAKNTAPRKVTSPIVQNPKAKPSLVAILLSKSTLLGDFSLRKQYDAKGLNRSPTEPDQIAFVVEQKSARARCVIHGISLQDLVAGLAVEQSVDDDGSRGVDDVVELVVDCLVQSLARVPVRYAEPELGDTQDDVFEEVVQNQS